MSPITAQRCARLASIGADALSARCFGRRGAGMVGDLAGASPLLTLTNLLQKLRSYAEHSGGPEMTPVGRAGPTVGALAGSDAPQSGRITSTCTSSITPVQRRPGMVCHSCFSRSPCNCLLLACRAYCGRGGFTDPRTRPEPDLCVRPTGCGRLLDPAWAPLRGNPQFDALSAQEELPWKLQSAAFRAARSLDPFTPWVCPMTHGHGQMTGSSRFIQS